MGLEVQNECVACKVANAASFAKNARTGCTHLALVTQGGAAKILFELHVLPRATDLPKAREGFARDA